MTKPRTGKSKLSTQARELLFVETYIANGRNASQAAIAAEYSASSAREMGCRLLKRESVQAMLKARQDALAKKYELTTESIIAELAKLVHADVRKVFGSDGTLLPMDQWPDEIAAAVASVEVFEEYEGTGKNKVFVGFTKKIKLWDKNPAIDKAMKHLGMFERDNKQKTDPLTELLARVSGSALKPVDE